MGPVLPGQGRLIVGASMPPLRRFVNWLLGFPDWLYGRRSAGFDLGPALMAGGWAWLMISRPALFDRGSFLGMSWLPDEVWIGQMLLLAGLHAIGLLRPACLKLRIAAALGSAWTWIFVSFSFARVEVSTGVLAYMIFGCGALCAAIYLAGQPPGEA